MAKGAASSQAWDWQARRSPVKTGARWPTLSMDEAEARVLGIQTKLHQWATCAPTDMDWRRARCAATPTAGSEVRAGETGRCESMAPRSGPTLL
jgi:hypothetical protein